MITHGKIYSYREHPIQVDVLGLALVFRQIRDETRNKGVFPIAQEDNSLIIDIVNIRTAFTTSEPFKFGETLGTLDNGDLEPQNLCVNFKYEPTKGDRLQFCISYTAYGVKAEGTGMANE